MRTIFASLLAFAAISLAACGGGGGSSGFVSLSRASSGPVVTTNLAAQFVDVPLSDLLNGTLPGCSKIAEQGSCFVIACQGGPPMYVLRTAGQVTASVAGADAVSATPGTSGMYSVTMPASLFSSGQTIGLRATGDAVPMFSGNVTAPEELVATIPASIARAADVTVSWPAAIAAERVQLTIIPTGPGPAISCTVPAGDGQIVVASSLLTQLMAGSSVIVALAAQNRVQVTAGAFTVLLAAQQAVISGATVN